MIKSKSNYMDCIIAGKIFSQEKPASDSHIRSLTQEITLKWNNHFSHVMNTQTWFFAHAFRNPL